MKTGWGFKIREGRMLFISDLPLLRSCKQDQLKTHIKQQREHHPSGLEKDIYDQGKIVATDSKGLVTISIQGRLVKLAEDTREIVDILNGQ